MYSQTRDGKWSPYGPKSSSATSLSYSTSGNIASVVVVDHAESPLGIVTDRDVLRALARIGITAFERPVSEAMESPAPSCLTDDTVNQVLRVMTERRVRHVVVMHDCKMAGIVSIGDLVKFKLKDAELENQILRDLALTRMAVE
jgi:CBS domain-containing protein